MKRAIPGDAKDVLVQGEWCHLAAATSFGPHVTPVVFAFDAGRLWLTTSRGSAKSRAWNRDPRTAGVIRHGDRAVTFRGRVRTYDALDPFGWPSIAVGSPRLGRAAARFSLKNARFFFGYAVDATRVPMAWAPPGRVFVSVEIESAWLLDLPAGAILDGWGPWPRGLKPARMFVEDAPVTTRVVVPNDVADAIATSGSAVVSTESSAAEGRQLTVLPAAWSHENDAYEARVPAVFAELTDVESGSRAALTVDRSSTWRASEMTGALIRGRANVFVRGRTRKGGALLRERLRTGEAMFRIAPERIVWWRGWSSGTVAPAAASPASKASTASKASKATRRPRAAAGGS